MGGGILRALALFLLCCSVFGSEYLSPVMHLRKIKMRLTGSDPTYSEYTEFVSAISGCSDQKSSSPDNDCVGGVLEGKIGEYMRTEAFIGTNVDFVHALLYLRPNDTPYEFRKTVSSLDLLVDDIFRYNRSWDDFFTSGRFRAFNGKVDFSLSHDSHYFSGHISPSQKPLPRDAYFDIEVADADLAAGFMITPRFNARYFNGTVNGGRKRAAAILRIGICDTMFPAVERGDEHAGLEDRIARGLSIDEEPIDSQSLEKLHGRRRDCMQCHIYRGLDHLAWTFRASELVLSLKPTPGRFTYLRGNGDLIDEPVGGIGDFARKLVELEEYGQCQVRNFWRRFVGSEEVLDENPAVFADAVSSFDALGRRVQDFITYLVLHPEFRRIDPPTAKTIDPVYGRVRDVFRHCSACHKGMPLPDFTSLPFVHGDGGDRTEYFVGRIIERLALEPYADAGERTMPPESSPWQPNAEDLEAIKAWIRAGAPDENGRRHLSESWFDGLLP